MEGEQNIYNIFPSEIYTHILSFTPCKTRLIDKKSNQLWLLTKINLFIELNKRKSIYETQESVIETIMLENTYQRVLLQKRWSTTDKNVQLIYLVDCYSGISWYVRTNNDISVIMKEMKLLSQYNQ